MSACLHRQLRSYVNLHHLHQDGVHIIIPDSSIISTSVNYSIILYCSSTQGSTAVGC